MAGAKTQSKRQAAPRTPKRSNVPTRPVIGSSSTWKEEELEQFKVQRMGNRDVKEMIPEKWFDFRGLTRFKTSNSTRE